MNPASAYRERRSSVVIASEEPLRPQQSPSTAFVADSAAVEQRSDAQVIAASQEAPESFSAIFDRHYPAIRDYLRVV